MKIVHKIGFLNLFLFLALALNTMIGLCQLEKIGRELQNVIRQDVVLTEAITAINQYQLQKSIYFQRVLSIAEEVGYEELTEARRKHLQDYAQVFELAYAKVSQAGNEEIIKGRKVLEQGLDKVKGGEHGQDLLRAQDILYNIEKAHRHYDEVVDQIFIWIGTGRFKLSLNDLKKIQKEERELSDQSKQLLTLVQSFTHKSMQKAKYEEAVAKKVLSNSLLVSIIIGSVLSFFIIKGISRPLKNLEKAARQISEGNFSANLDESSRDEIGEVSRAFNKMSKRLAEALAELERTNREIAENLKITKQQKRDLEKVNKELDNFVHTVSHDLRAPLSGILGYSSILHNQYLNQFDERGVRCLEGIGKGINRLNGMIEDLLTLTRITRVQNPYELTDISEVLRSVLGRLDFKIIENNVQISIQENLPQIICDKIKMGEVFLNLVSNAIKFSSKNNLEKPKIQIGYVDQGDFHEFYVKDNGIGIAPKDQSKIFMMFKRLHTAEEYEGTGAGLSIVKEIISDHGGRIWIESQIKEGACFLFTIPRNLAISSNPEKPA